MSSRNDSGFTIVELMIAVAVSAIASVLILTAFVFTYGSILVEQTRTGMVRDSQIFLRRMVEDIRVSNKILVSNTISDPYRTGGWTTSDPANILVATLPATDYDRNFVYDTTTGDPLYHEVVYYSQGGKMFRHLIANPLASGSAQASTCPAPSTGCPRDIEIVSNVENMLFVFHDIGDSITTDPGQARSLQITVNLSKQLSGQKVKTTNTTRITLRNE